MWGAPIRDHRGRVIAALSLSGLSGNLTPERIPQLVEMVKEAAAHISAHLGYEVAAHSYGNDVSALRGKSIREGR